MGVVAGEDFEGVQEVLRDEGGADFVHGGEVGGGEHVAHVFEFFDADAVFAGDAAADGDAVAEDFARSVEGGLHAFGIVFVVHEDGVDIAVAGVEDAGDAQMVLGANFRDAGEHLGQLAAGDAGVLGTVAGADAADGAEGFFAGAPEIGAAFRVAAAFEGGDVVFLAEGFDGGEVFVEAEILAVDFDDDEGLGGFWEAEMEGVLDDADHGAVEHFHGGGDDARGDDFRDGAACGLGVVEDGESGADVGGFCVEAAPDFGDDVEGALGAAEAAGDVGADVVAVGAAEGVDGAVAEDDFETEDVVDGDAVFEGVESAGISGGVSADGAGTLAAGVGGEVVGGILDGDGECGVGDAGFDEGDAVAEVDVEDFVHAGGGDLDAGGDGDDSAAESGGRAAGHDGDVVLSADVDGVGDLLGVFGEDDGEGFGAGDGEAVAFVDDEFIGIRDDGGVAEGIGGGRRRVGNWPRGYGGGGCLRGRTFQWGSAGASTPDIHGTARMATNPAKKQTPMRASRIMVSPVGREFI